MNKQITFNCIKTRLSTCLTLLAATMLTVGTLDAQTSTKIKATGKVTDQAGEPIVSCSVVLKDGHGTVTDIDGNFTIEVPQGATIVVKYIGYITEETTVRDSRPLAIVLKEDVQKLDEVVVIGYGVRQRKNITGAVDQVDAKMFADRPVANAMQALQGAAANHYPNQKHEPERQQHEY
jgi:hypothetical protein